MNQSAPRFNITTLETCDRDFLKAKSEMTLWEWEKGGYEALYLSCRKRLLNKQKEDESKIAKNKRTKK